MTLEVGETEQQNLNAYKIYVFNTSMTYSMYSQRLCRLIIKDLSLTVFCLVSIIGLIYFIINPNLGSKLQFSMY